MRICIFSAQYFPHLGGVERFTYHISKEFIKMGHEVTVVTSNVPDIAPHEVSDGIEIYRLPCHKALKGRYPIYKKNAEFKEIDSALRSKGFDYIFINTRFYFHSLYGARLANELKIPCLTVEHGSSHLSVNNKVLDFFGGIFEHFITSLLKHRCKDYYGVSKTACDWSGHFGIKSKGTLYNAVDLEQINELLQNPVCSYREQLLIPEDALVVTYTGRLLPEKGIIELAEAFIKADIENACLLYAGDGDMQPELERYAERCSNIKLLGRLSFEEVIALLRESDIYCLPSVSEGMSTSVLEAIAAKTFVITTYNGGARELITDESLGIIMMGNSVEEIIKAIEKARDSEYRAKAAEKAYKRLEADFTWEKTALRAAEIMEMDLKK